MARLARLHLTSDGWDLAVGFTVIGVEPAAGQAQTYPALHRQEHQGARLFDDV